MPLPEYQIVALVGTASRHRLTQCRQLLVAVAGAGDRTGQKGRLNKARTINACPGIAAPQIGRAQKQRGHGRRVGCQCADAMQMLARDVAKRRFHEGGRFRQRGDVAAEAEDQCLAGFDIGCAVGVTGSHCHVMCRCGDLCQCGCGQMADIGVLFRPHIGPVVSAPQNRDLIAEQQLSVAFATGCLAQINLRYADLSRCVFGHQSGIRCAARVAHALSRSVNATRKARVA